MYTYQCKVQSLKCNIVSVMCKMMQWVRRNRMSFLVIRGVCPSWADVIKVIKNTEDSVYISSNKHFIVYSLFWSPCTTGLELVSVWGRNKAIKPKLCWLGLNILEDGLEIGKLCEYWKMKSLEQYRTIPPLVSDFLNNSIFFILWTPPRLSLSLIFLVFWLTRILLCSPLYNSR